MTEAELELQRYDAGRALVSYCLHFDRFISEHAASGAPEPIVMATQLLDAAGELAERFDGEQRELFFTHWIDKRLRMLVALRPFVGVKRGQA